MAVQGALFLMVLEEQADQEGGEAVTMPLLLVVQASKAVRAARALTKCAVPLGEVVVVLGR